MPKIAETVFDPREASARAALRLRLASQPGRPVPDAELILSVGGIALFRRALARLMEDGERTRSIFVVERQGEACALQRRF